MLNIQNNVSLKEYTTFKTGGQAAYFVQVKSLEELNEAAGYAKQNKLPVCILGGGSNVLISDSGFEGLVILNQISGLKISNSGIVKAFSGGSWDEVAKQASEKNLAGIECLSGIPGSVGGAVVQNIGAYGQTIADIVDFVTVVNTKTGEIEDWPRVKCKFEYRNSYFKKHPTEYFVLAVALKLRPKGKATTSYKDVQEFFQDMRPKNLTEVRDAVIKIRAAKGYVIMPEFESYLSAGSFFKNPVVSSELFEDLQKKVPESDRPWSWADENNQTKVSAAFLVGAAGFDKGYVQGPVGISPKHSLALINIGNAQASDIHKLSKQIKDKVFAMFGVQLENEVQLVGKFD